MKKIIGLIGVILTFALICAFATGCNNNDGTTGGTIPGVGSTSETTNTTESTDGTTNSTVSGQTTAPTNNTTNSTNNTTNSANNTTKPTTTTPATTTTKPATTTTKPGDVTTGTTVAPNELVIFLDPGHGGKPEDDGSGTEAGPGAVREYEGVTYKEAEINLAVALKAKAELEARGYKVVLSRTDDTFVGLADRPAAALEAKANMFISIHVNSHTGNVAHGFEAFYSGKDGLKYDAKAFADLFTKEFEEIKDVPYDPDPTQLAYPNMTIRGTKADTELYTSGLAVLNRKESYLPSTLLELGFITNDKDLLMLKSEYWQNFAAEAIADAVVAAHEAGIYKVYEK